MLGRCDFTHCGQLSPIHRMGEALFASCVGQFGSARFRKGELPAAGKSGDRVRQKAAAGRGGTVLASSHHPRHCRIAAAPPARAAGVCDRQGHPFLRGKYAAGQPSHYVLAAPLLFAAHGSEHAGVRSPGSTPGVAADAATDAQSADLYAAVTTGAVTAAGAITPTESTCREALVDPDTIGGMVRVQLPALSSCTQYSSRQRITACEILT